MTLKNNIVFVLIGCVVYYSCNINQKNNSIVELAKKKEGKGNDSDLNSGFIDSVTKKITISNEYIEKNTVIQGYSFDLQYSFVGDSVYSWNKRFAIAIIDYKGIVNCKSTLLLVIDVNKNKNTDFIEGAFECDFDNNNNRTKSFKILNDSQLVITTSFYDLHGDSYKEDIKKRKKNILNINRDGRLVGRRPDL